MRGAAALIVLIAHYQWLFAIAPGQWPNENAAPLHTLLWPIYEYGGMAVQMFWLLSGFVFTAAYGRYGKGLDLRKFAIARFARLYPLHFATLLLTAFFQSVSLALHGEWQIFGGNDVPAFVSHLLLASNWTTIAASFNGPIWSVSVEILIYAVFLAYLRRDGLNLAGAGMIAVIALIMQQITGSPIALCGFMFFSGVVMGIVAPQIQERAGSGGIALALVGLGLAPAFWVFGLHPVRAIYIAMPAILFLLVMLDLNAKPLPKPFHWIGNITYSVYLLHMPIMIGALTFFKGIFTDRGVIEYPGTLAGYIATVLVLSAISYRYFEIPMRAHVLKIFEPPRRVEHQSSAPSFPFTP